MIDGNVHEMRQRRMGRAAHLRMPREGHPVVKQSFSGARGSNRAARCTTRGFAADYVPVCSPKLPSRELAPAAKARGFCDCKQLLHDDTRARRIRRPSWGDWLASRGASQRSVRDARTRISATHRFAIEAAIEGGMGVAPRGASRCWPPRIHAGRHVFPSYYSSRRRTGVLISIVTPETEARATPPSKAFRSWIHADGGRRPQRERLARRTLRAGLLTRPGPGSAGPDLRLFRASLWRVRI
jgi:hypothetical protein